MIPRVIISGKASKGSINGAGKSGGHPEPHGGGFREQSPLRKPLGPKDHLAWLKIDLNETKTITVSRL